MNFFKKRILFEKYLNNESRRNDNYPIKSLSKTRTDYYTKNDFFNNQDQSQIISMNNFLSTKKSKPINISSKLSSTRNCFRATQNRIKKHCRNLKLSEDITSDRYSTGVILLKNDFSLNQSMKNEKDNKNYYCLVEKLDTAKNLNKKRRNFRIIENEYENRKRLLINSFRLQKKFVYQKIHTKIKNFISSFIFNMKK